MTYHYYAFSFMELFPNGRMGVGSSYVGLPSPKVTRDNIDEARRLSQTHPNSVLLSCSYLGEMTEAEFGQR